MGVQMFTNGDESYQNNNVQVLCYNQIELTHSQCKNITRYKNQRETKVLWHAYDYLQMIKRKLSIIFFFCIFVNYTNKNFKEKKKCLSHNILLFIYFKMW